MKKPGEKYTPEQVIDAAKGSHGIVAAAARKLGCTRTTVYAYRDRYPEVRAALEDERETLLDLAEATLFEKAIREKATTSLIFLLKTIGKGRGYVERQDITTGDQPLPGVLASQEWQAVRGAILSALDDHPKARVAVARALGETNGNGRRPARG